MVDHVPPSLPPSGADFQLSNSNDSRQQAKAAVDVVIADLKRLKDEQNNGEECDIDLVQTTLKDFAAASQIMNMDHPHAFLQKEKDELNNSMQAFRDPFDYLDNVFSTMQGLSKDLSGT